MEECLFLVRYTLPIMGYNTCMSRSRLLSILAVLVCLIALLHFTAMAFYLYWTLWWYDIILHFLGGAFVGLLALWLRYFSGYAGIADSSRARSALYFVLCATLGIGIGWEVFERLLGLTYSVEGYVFDTSIDLLMDCLGSLVAFQLCKRTLTPYESNT